MKMNKLEEKRLERQLRNGDGKRMVAWNAYLVDDIGVIWCMVHEDDAGYKPMTGKGLLSSPWYLAYKSNHTDEDGKVDYKSMFEAAEKLVDKVNWDNGYTKKEVGEVVASSIRASNLKV